MRRPTAPEHLAPATGTVAIRGQAKPPASVMLGLWQVGLDHRFVPVSFARGTFTTMLPALAARCSPERTRGARGTMRRQPLAPRFTHDDRARRPARRDAGGHREVDWEAGELRCSFSALFLMDRHGKSTFRLVGHGLTRLSLPRAMPWGPSLSVNTAACERRSDDVLLTIEMQSGDVIEADVRNFTLA